MNNSWHGKSIPPEGTICEYNSNWAHAANFESWHKVRVVFLSDCTYVVRREDQVAGEITELCGMASIFEAKRFRPFITPEEIAAGEIETIFNWMVNRDSERGLLGIAEDLHADGYRRKPPQPPEEKVCSCPIGDGSLRWPCPVHPPAEKQQ
ncbi:hypothetical protein [Pseudomonas sp. 1121_17]|uniref:hypothetical protein n=1 Tax=Pseudomonas sp. 1121_17 TaxID=2604458 RepID=UPI0040635FEB